MGYYYDDFIRTFCTVCPIFEVFEKYCDRILRFRDKL